MIVAIEHVNNSLTGHVTELHCPERVARAVARAIRRLTGEHPVKVPLCDCTVSYFCNQLTLEEACALLRMIACYGTDPEQIDRDLLAAEVQLGQQDQRRSAAGERDLLGETQPACAICRSAT